MRSQRRGVNLEYKTPFFTGARLHQVDPNLQNCGTKKSALEAIKNRSLADVHKNDRC